eukprot:3934838-Rhodomonas_salina.3
MQSPLSPYANPRYPLAICSITQKKARYFVISLRNPRYHPTRGVVLSAWYCRCTTRRKRGASSHGYSTLPTVLRAVRY